MTVPFIDNEMARRLLSVEASIEFIERAYRSWDLGEATVRPKTHLFVTDDAVKYNFVTMEGALRPEHIVALRIRSDLHRLGSSEDRIEKEAGLGGKYCGLVLWFDSRSGAPLAIANDGYLQHVRVAAIAAVAAREMARSESRTLGILGSSWMARTHLAALAAVRPIDSVRVYSPSKANRETFASTMSTRTCLDVTPVDSAEQAVTGADIVAACTNSRVPVFSGSWMEKGSFLTCVLPTEVGSDVLARVSRTVRHQLPPTDRVAFGIGEAAGEWEGWKTTYSPDDPTILDVLAGRASGREDEEEITFFTNNEGNGLQFAALGAALLSRLALTDAESTRSLPLDWFLQDIAT